MARARFLYDNLVTRAGVVFTASSEQAAYPATHLAHPGRWKKYLAAVSSAATQSVVVDLGAAVNFQGIALIDAVLHAGGAVRVQANSADSWGAHPFDELLVIPSHNPTRILSHWHATPVSYRYLRILFENTLAVSQAVSLGALVIGPVFEPTKNITSRVLVTPIDPSAVVSSVDGQELVFRRTGFSRVQAEYTYLGATDRRNFRTMFDAVGRRTPLVFAADPDQADHVWYGTFARRRASAIWAEAETASSASTTAGICSRRQRAAERAAGVP